MMRMVAPQQTKAHWGYSLRSSAPNRAILVACLVGVVSFAATEFMHYLLVPDLGRRWERLLAEGVSAVVVALLTAKLVHAANQRREAALLRMQVISEMNHHIRNALAAISLSTDSMENQQSMRVIADSVDRIEWALREILLRRTPLPEDRAPDARYFQPARPLNHPNARKESNRDPLAIPQEKHR